MKNLNKKKILNLRMFRFTEVSKFPKSCPRFKLECPHGGFYLIAISKSKKGFTLYFGGSSHTEPVCKINHFFKSINEAIYYTWASNLIMDAREAQWTKEEEEE